MFVGIGDTSYRFSSGGCHSGRRTQLWSRNQKDFTRRFPGVVKGIADII
jgi:hypothetical protein